MSVPVIDMHLNPLEEPSGDRVAHVSRAEVDAAARAYRPRLAAASVRRAVLVVLSPGAFGDGETPPLELGPEYAVAWAPDFRDARAEERLERARAAGVAALKFHPYIQRITPSDYGRAETLARQAEQLGMFVMVCCSYGTRALERHDGVRLAAALAGAVNCPIVMSHAGGRQVLDAMLVADAAPQVLLDLSFSLPYYRGSSVEQDFAFAMRKLGPERWMFGSDAPFVPLAEAIAAAHRFFDDHDFDAAAVEQIFHGTAAALLQGR